MGRFKPDFESCLALAEITGRSPDAVLEAAGHDPRRLNVVRAARPGDSAADRRYAPWEIEMLSDVREVPPEHLATIRQIVRSLRAKTRSAVRVRNRNGSVSTASRPDDSREDAALENRLRRSRSALAGAAA